MCVCVSVRVCEVCACFFLTRVLVVISPSPAIRRRLRKQMVLGLEKRTALLDAALLRADDLEEQLSVHQRPVFTTRDDGDGPLSDDTSEGSASFHDDTATGSDAAASDVGDEPDRSDGDSERPSAPGSGDLGVAPDGSEEAAPVVAVVNEDGSTATGEVESLRTELVKAKADLEAAEQTTATLRGVLGPFYYY